MFRQIEIFVNNKQLLFSIVILVLKSYCKCLSLLVTLYVILVIVVANSISSFWSRGAKVSCL